MLLSRLYTAVLVAALAGSGAAWAAGANNNGAAPDVSSTAGAQASAATSAKGVRAYAIVSGETFLVNKGFKAVRRASTGVYCLKPKVKLDLEQIAPSVTVEWGNSSGNNLSAFYHQKVPLGCTEKEIEVLTFRFAAGGNNELGDSVAFVISVP